MNDEKKEDCIKLQGFDDLELNGFEDLELNDFDLELNTEDLKIDLEELELSNIDSIILTDDLLIEVIKDLQVIGIDGKSPESILKELKDYRTFKE